MMSLARSVSASQAEEYYYQKDPFFAPEGKGENSAWYGSAMMAALGIPVGNISSATFMNLLSGQDPRDGRQLVPAGVNDERRAGIDLAFSAPKSVSIAALHLGDDRIVEAHKAAVTKALEFVEQNLIQYREKIAGEMFHIQSKNMIAAQFLHATSRSNDPQLHTHAIVQNITQTATGGFKAISNELIFQHQTLVNNIYQNELAIELQKLGYAIDNYKNKFEIRGIEREVCENFSKRSKEIDEMYERIKDDYPHLTPAEIRERAVLQSRQNKDVTITKEELLAQWQLEAAREDIQPIYGDKRQFERDLIKLSLQEIQKTEATFSRNALLNVMIVQSRGEFALDELESLLDGAIAGGTIVQMGKHENTLHYSTPEMINTESCIVAAVTQGLKSTQALLDEATAEERLIDSLTIGQRTFVKRVLTTEDFLTVIQGDAGTGKTFAVAQLREIIESEKLDTSIIGLGFTGKAAQELAEAAKIETSTIASFLLSKDEISGKTIIVDEASMVSSADMLALIERAKQGKDNRIVLIGDKKQLQAIGAGKMFAELQRQLIVDPVTMEEVLRQKTETTQALVKNIKDYQDAKNKEGISEAFEIMGREAVIEEVTSKSKDADVTTQFIREYAIKEYFKSEDSILLSSSRAEKHALNMAIREQIFSKEQLANQMKVKIKESIAESFLAADYSVGDKFRRGTKEFIITAVNSNDNTITAEYHYKRARKGETVTINLFDEQIAAYREVEQQFLAGEKIIFTKNDKRLGVQNGLSGTIEGMDKSGNMTVILKNKKKVIFNVADYASIDYGYALTLHKSQGQTCRKAIVVHNAGDRMATEAFYVAVTRATHEVKVLTPNIEKLQKSVAKAQDKTSTREFVREI